jgi:signal transduction histidine kinase
VFRHAVGGEAREVILKIKDIGIGIGIESDKLTEIFGAFKKLHACTEYPGTGIGLAIVSKIIQRHGGSIDVESSLGQGTCFSIYLPRGAEGEQQDKTELAVLC